MAFKYINDPLFANDNEELKSVYNKWRTRQFGKRVPAHIFGSDSAGNSVYLKPYHTLIDLGLPYKRYQEYCPNFFLNVDFIILTHHHGDHLNPATLKRVMRNYPHIRIFMTDFMWQYITSELYQPTYIKRQPNEPVPFGHDPVYQTDDSGRRLIAEPKHRKTFLEHQSKVRPATAQTLTTHNGRSFYFEPLTVKHGDVLNIAVQISDPALEFDLLYASDLDNLGGPRSFIDCFGNTQYVTGLHQERVYTCMFLEANYDENLLQQWYSKLDPQDPEYRSKKARADGNLRHISEQEAGAYIEKHLADGGLFIPLHASKTFGTLHQG